MTDKDEPKYGKPIMQFMWGYQSYFRIGVETCLERAFRLVGFTEKPEVLLVGFQTGGTHVYPICIEPEDGPYSPPDLGGVRARSDELYEGHPDQDMLIIDSDGGRSGHDSFHKRLHKGTLGKAIEEALASTSAGNDKAFFASFPAQVGDYSVHVVIGLAKKAYDMVPRLRTTRRDRFTVYPSIIDAIIHDVLRRAVRGLYVPDAGSDLDALGAEATEVVQAAATRFVTSALFCAGYYFGSESSAAFSSLSALPYEGRAGAGRLLLAKAEHPALEVKVKFREPISMNDDRAVRKLIEATGPDSDLLSTGEEIYGIGHLGDDYDATSEQVFVVTLRDHGTWELSHDERTLLTVRDGIPSLPRTSLNTSYFGDIVNRLLSGADGEALLALAQAAAGSEHGAMLVISSDAAGEARRLAPQAWSVEPVRLSPQLLRQFTSMDGGILVDPQGECHAIGVIVDGVACGREDPARGSRFNNAVRYLESESPPSVIVVYSVDGSIDVLPYFRPRVKRMVVEQAVKRYLALATPGEVQPSLAEAFDLVRRLRFYLSEEQCSQINVALSALQRWNKEHSTMWVVEERFDPDPDMNESYWLPE